MNLFLIEIIKPFFTSLSRKLLKLEKKDPASCIDKLDSLSKEAQILCLKNQELQIRRRWWNRLITYLGFVVILVLLFTAYETTNIGLWIDDFVSFLVGERESS